MQAYKELRILVVNEDIQKGLKEFNDYIKVLQQDGYQIHEIHRSGNVYDITVQITPRATHEQKVDEPEVPA